MRPIEPFVMPKYRCKCCGKIICEPQLKSFRVEYGDCRCLGQWCLCEDCILNGVTMPKSAGFGKKVLCKNTAAFLSELAEIISRYKVNPEDVFFVGDE